MTTKNGKGIGGRVWPATRTAGNCGLKPGTPLVKGDKCLFLTCAGAEARPEYQICQTGTETVTDRWGREKERKIRETPGGRQFRSVPTGKYRCRRNACGEVYNYNQRYCQAPHPDATKRGNCKSKTKPVFKWQEQDLETERWHDVSVWEKVILAEEGVRLGYHVPRRSDGAFVETTANEGSRTEGHAHKLSAVPEAPLADLARAGLTPEELGEVAPAPPPVNDLPDDPGEARFKNLDLD